LYILQMSMQAGPFALNFRKNAAT